VTDRRLTDGCQVGAGFEAVHTTNRCTPK